jgi:hypothetical protein
LKEQNAPRVHFQIESFGMERPGGVQKLDLLSIAVVVQELAQESCAG